MKTKPNEYIEFMTKREKFSMVAMQGLLSVDRESFLVNGGYLSFDLLAADAVKQADALIEALNKEVKNG